jgi:glycine/D-amino acid oxidase-like deaminating enzyme
LGNDKYWAGASFEQEDKSLSVTAEGAQWLIDKIDRMIDVPYTIEKHITHIRPTVKDRRPLLGTHDQYLNIHLLNGMGSRGVLTSPSAAKWLFNHIKGQVNLPKEVDINRFEKIG